LLKTAVQRGLLQTLAAGAVDRAETALGTPWPPAVRRCLLQGGADIWNLFGMSMQHCTQACATPGGWLWNDGPARFDSVELAKETAMLRGGDPTATVFQGAVLLGDVPGPVVGQIAVLVLTGLQRGEVWVLSAGAATEPDTGTDTDAEPVLIAPLALSALKDVVPPMDTSLTSIVAYACTQRMHEQELQQELELKLKLEQRLRPGLGQEDHVQDAVSLDPLEGLEADDADCDDSGVPFAHPGVRATDAVFEPLSFWAGGPCAAIADHEASVAPEFCLPCNPSRPCDGVLVSGLPACGDSFWDTVCALDIGLVVTLLPLPLTWVGPAASLPGQPTPTLPESYVPHDPHLRLDAAVADEEVTDDEIRAVQYAINFRVDRGVPTTASDVLQRRDPLRFAKALRAAATVRGVVFLHLPTPDGHVLHTAHAAAVVQAAQDAWLRGTRVWVHCWAGVYRSYLTALLIMQRCKPRNTHLPLLDPCRVEASLFSHLSRSQTQTQRQTRAATRTAVRWAHLDAIEAAAARHCRCTPEKHYTWLVLGHPRLAHMTYCLQDVTAAEAIVAHARTWVAALDAEAFARLRIAYDLSDLEGPCSGVWAWLRDAVTTTLANLGWDR
jgi:hypothetical protein